ncbi:MAG TPA: acetyl-CoA carboxylase biotin carboxyl carrier protein [Clostridiales bacterium]|nr:acetyl-CoA carboxylase biotin carboxyl carrier protein [Clostridiales bacterium]
MDYKAIINLIKEMNQTDFTRLEIEEEGLRIYLEKGNGTPQHTLAQPVGSQVVTNPPVTTTISQPSVTVSNEVNLNNPKEEGKTVVSPMVGTFYAAPGPEKPPFVKVGDKVKKGQTLCIIEAMKLMNEIESEYDGEVLEILTKNEEMVEYGQPLFVIK